MRETKFFSNEKKHMNAFFFIVLGAVFLFFIFLALDFEEEDSQGVFSEQLPVIVIDTKGQEIDEMPGEQEEFVNDNLVTLQENSKRYKASLSLYNSDPNLASFKLDSEFDTDIVINTRGQSSLSYPKKQYTVRFVDENGYKNPKQVLNMPKHDKWVLNGMYSDKSLMRNQLAYKLGEQSMEYSPKTRYVEVYLKTNEISSKEEQYQGIYLLTEKIDRSPNRVNIQENEAKYNDTSFIMARDKIKAGDVVLQSDWNKLEEEYSIIPKDTLKLRTVFTVTYPNKDNITDQDKENIVQSLNDFEYALRSDNFRDKRSGYQEFVDIDSFIKFAMINEITKNIDGGEVSTYFYKDIGRKIKAGPIWDFDMSLGNTNIKDVDNPSGFLMLDRIWYDRFFQDEFFANQYKRIYRSYRKSIWSDENINLLINQSFLELEPAIQRNNDKWFKDESIDDYVHEVEALREFLITRLQWMDENIDLVKRVTQGVTE